MSSHFSLEQWTDFVRDLVDPRTRAAMEQHAAVCAACASDRQAMALVGETVALDAELTVGAATRRRVLALAAELPAAPRSSWRRLLASLSFDSGTLPAPVGVRTGHQGVRQLVFDAERYQVHLQWEVAAPGRPVALVGRISNAADAALARGLLVRALTDDDVAAEATTNQFGEFVLECAWDPALTIDVPVRAEGVRIELPLGSVTGAPPTSSRKKG